MLLQLLEFCIFAAIAWGDNTDTLQSVVVIYRHGDRTPVHPYPTDPYKNRSYWPVDFGQLTNTGKRQHLELGKWLRKRYDAFLPETYSENDIYVRATDVDRTLMSAEANLAGLYPPSQSETWDPEIKWQPIPVHTMPEKQDPFVAMEAPCPYYDYLHEQLLKSALFMNITHKNHDLYAYLTRYSGSPVTDLKTLEYLYNTLYIEDLYNYTLPDWAQSVYPEKLYPWAAMSFAVDSYTPQMARLKIGLLFNEILTHFKNKTLDNIPARKFLVYSGHDITIGTALNAMGAFEYHCPPYASTVILELHKTGGKYHVNMFYKNSSTDLNQIVLANCQFDCDFGKFGDILKPLVLDIDQWHRECYTGMFFVLWHKMAVWVWALMALVTFTTLLTTVFYVSRAKNRRITINENRYVQLPNDEEA